MPHFLNRHQPAAGASREAVEEQARQLRHQPASSKCASSCFPDALPGGGWSRESYHCASVPRPEQLPG
eukprot:scaffold28815_cov44-Phaeocystis_antarctica.AAC.1